MLPVKAAEWSWRMKDFLKLGDRICIVTGAGSPAGIGFATARMLGEAGATVIIVSTTQRIYKRQNELRKEGLLADGHMVDLMDRVETERFVGKVMQQYGRIDALVNNAGMAHKSPIQEMTPELYDRIMNVNVKAPYFLTQKALDYLRLSDVPTIINVSSVVAHRGYKNQSVFTISKHALMGLSKAFAVETLEEGVRVHTITPGAVLTDLIGMIRPDLKPDDLIKPQDIADVVSFFLLHRKSSFVVDEIRMRRIGKEPF